MAHLSSFKFQDVQVNRKGDSNVLEKITKYIKDNKILIRRGDCVHLGDNRWQRYRNEWVFIWDGEKTIGLHTDIDDYGSVPKQFTTREFPVRHWKGVIEHNNLFNLEPDCLKDVTFQINFRDKLSSFLLIRDEPWICVLENMNLDNIRIAGKPEEKVATVEKNQKYIIVSYRYSYFNDDNNTIYIG